MDTNINPLFIRICKENSIKEIQDKAQELQSEFVWDWEDEFDNLNDAYLEQGGNAAEQQVINELINNNCMYLPIEIHHKLFSMLALHYELEVD